MASPAAPPASPESPGPAGTPSALASPAPSQRPSRRTFAVVAAVAVIVVVVLALLLSGIIPGLHTSSSSGQGVSNRSSEQSAASSATVYAGYVSGGPWSLYLAAGIDTTIGYNTSVSSIGLGNASCPLTGSKVTNLVVPGYNGTYSDGLAEAWLMGFLSSTGTGAGLFLFVQNGAVADLGEITAPGCEKNAGAAPLPGGLIDSTTAASDAVATSNGSRYVSAIAHSNATYDLSDAFGSGSSAIPVWAMVFSSCSDGDSSEFIAEVYATNGTLVYPAVYETTPSPQCGAPSTPPLGTAFAWGVPVNATGTTPAGCPSVTGHYCYSIEIAGAEDLVSTSNIQLSLRTAAGAAVRWPSATVSLDTPTSMTSVAAYSTATATWALVPPFDGELTAGDSVVIFTSSVGAGNGLLGLELVATGVDGFSGTVVSSPFS